MFAQDKGVAKLERALNRTQRELDRTRADLHTANSRAKAARDAVIPMRKRIVELEASLTRERARNDKLVAATEQREQAWEKATAKLTELHKLQNEHAAIHWGELESQLRAEVAATTADCEARIAKYQRDYEFMQAVAAKGGAPVITQNVRRGSCVRRNMRQRKMAAIQIQARWRGAAQR